MGEDPEGGRENRDPGRRRREDGSWALILFRGGIAVGPASGCIREAVREAVRGERWHVWTVLGARWFSISVPAGRAGQDR